MKALTAKVAAIQSSLNAPKGQHNNFGGYSYRSCEDILQALKPLLSGLVLTINDEMFQLGDRIYVKATAAISDGENSISATAYAREAQVKKGMDESQITGSASSYARKYALNGLLLIDDNKDADSRDNREQVAAKPADYRKEKAQLTACTTLAALKTAWQGLSTQARTALAADKDSAKARIEQGVAA